MKCRRCDTSCSDLRDICPNCYMDFRPIKAEEGLQIINPTASYDSLLEKLGVDIQSLFDAEAEELGREDESFEFNIGASSLVGQIEPQEAELLFDLALEAIDDPEAENKYAEPTFTEGEGKLKSEVLQKELESIREKITAPLLGLKQPVASSSNFKVESVREGEQADPDEEKVAHYRSLARVTPRARLLKSFLIDLMACLVVSLFFTIFLVAYLDMDILIFALKGGWPSALEQVLVTSLFICSFFVSLIAYPLLSLIFYDSTFGTRSSGLQILREDGEVLDISRIIVRSCSLPVYLLFFLYIPVAFGKRALHDFVAGTVTFEASPDPG